MLLFAYSTMVRLGSRSGQCGGRQGDGQRVQEGLTISRSVLCVSSQVTFGSVGNAVAVPALEQSGVAVLGLPTIILSNHPGLGKPASLPVPDDVLADVLDRLIDSEWLDGCSGILTGYFSSAEQVAVVAERVRAIKARNPGCLYLCDPVLGDSHTGVYVPETVAQAIRQQLIPLADAVSPNTFELEWLSGMAADGISAASAAAKALGVPIVFATSVNSGNAAEVLTAVFDAGSASWVSTARRQLVPHGTGDLLAGLLLASLVHGRPPSEALALAVAQLDHVIEASAGKLVLELAPNFDALGEVKSLPLEPYAKARMVAGVDGCRGGWMVVLWDGLPNSTPTATICSDFASVIDLSAQIVAVDMPIGFPERAEHGGRKACAEARARLGARQSSVFSVPSRAAVMCRDYGEACEVNLQNSEPPRKVSKQCFMLFDKMREVDRLMSPEQQSRVYEVHPELAFWAMNGCSPLELPKKVKSRPDAPGLALRENLLRNAGFPFDALEVEPHRASAAGRDDLIDACAAAWSALRISRQQHITLPPEPPRDGRGLRMEINA